MRGREDRGKSDGGRVMEEGCKEQRMKENGREGGTTGAYTGKREIESGRTEEGGRGWRKE